jgi:hypothetical protein
MQEPNLAKNEGQKNIMGKGGRFKPRIDTDFPDLGRNTENARRERRPE